MVEQTLARNAENLVFEFKIALMKRQMTQRVLAEFVGTDPQQLNRAIHGDTSPKAQVIRKKAAKILGIEI